MINISKPQRDFITSRKQYADVYSNKISSFTKTAYSDVFAVKSFLTKSTDKDAKLYIPINIPRLISHTFADYEVGEWFSLKFKWEGKQSKWEEIIADLDLEQIMYDVAVKKSYMGYTVLRVRKEENKSIRIDHIPNKNYFPNTDGLFLWSTYRDIPEHTIMTVGYDAILKESVAYIESYKEQNDQRLCIFEKHKYNTLFEFTEKTKINDLPGNGKVVKHLPIVIINNDLKNSNEDETKVVYEHGLEKEGSASVSTYFGESDYIDIMDLVQDLNDRKTQISVEFIKHLTSKMSVPSWFAEYLNTKKQRAIQIAEKRGEQLSQDDIAEEALFEWVVHKQGETPAHYITKDNSILQTALEEIKDILRYISSLTRIPKRFLGIEEKSGNGHVGTMDREMEVFYKRIQQKRKNTWKVIKHIVGLLFFYTTEVYEENLTIDFAKLEIRDVQTVATMVTGLFQSWLLSKFTAIKKVYDREDEKVEEELTRIKEDERLQWAMLADLSDNDNDDEWE